MKKANHFPEYRGHLNYVCLGCDARYDINELHYTCPRCNGVFLLEDKTFSSLKQTSGQQWQTLFDLRAATKNPALRGIFRFYELIAPVLEPEDIISIGEGQTYIVPASNRLQEIAGQAFAYKNDGQNPSASFKDRGMACAFSYLNSLIRKMGWDQVLTVCASTGDTSASAALYAAYVGPSITSIVLLPQGKVTPQQLAQPLGSGSVVLEIPGVFDDCMQVVEYLADNFRVALLNSKNAWRILGQESYAFEVAQWFDWDLAGKAIFVPIGNAGNITAIMNGFLKLHYLGIIKTLPRIVGVQSEHADPVFKYYQKPAREREFHPVTVSSSVAQAAMIGNPVSFPRVRTLAAQYENIGGSGSFNVVQVKEQEIIENMLLANRYGHIACTQGGECLAGLQKAIEMQILDTDEYAVLDATAHMLKFIGFQQMYFENNFPAEYEITPKAEFINTPQSVLDAKAKEQLPQKEYVAKTAEEIVRRLKLVTK